MPLLLYTIIAMLLGVCVVGLFAALGVRRDEILKNPSMPGTVGERTAIALAVAMIILVIILIAYPPCQ
jgi:hypothetical protein